MAMDNQDDLEYEVPGWHHHQIVVISLSDHGDLVWMVAAEVLILL
jgi:hypothetical protein